MGDDLAWMLPRDVLNKRVLSGLGEEIGVVVAVDTYPDGEVRKLHIFENGLPQLREVPARFVRSLGGVVQLKGPREGFHITRLGVARSPLAPPALPALRPESIESFSPPTPGTVRETL